MSRVRPSTFGILVTVAFGVLLGAYVGVVRTTTGSWGPFDDPRNWAIEAWVGVVLGVGAAMASFAARATARDLIALAPALSLSAERLENEIRVATSVFGRGFCIWTIGWAALALALTASGFDTFWAGRGEVETHVMRDPFLPWACARNGALAGVLFAAAWVEVALSLRVGRLVGEHGLLDLADRTRYASLGRRARRNALGWAFLSFVSTPFLVVLGATVALPVWQLHKRLEREKQRQLAKLRDQISARAGSVIEGRTEPGPALADLVAYEQRLAATSSWVYETSTLVRAAAFALIGAGSWIGAALVERALDFVAS